MTANSENPARPEKRDYLEVPEYEARAFALCEFSRSVMLCLADHDLTTRQVVLRNAFGKSCVLLRSVFRLYDLADISSCWVLNRCLLDRLLTIYDLIDNDSFDQFEGWSFLQQWNSRNRARGHREFRERLDLSFFRDPDTHRRRHEELIANPPNWVRPRLETVAKRRNLKFLYTLSYDFGSMMVHPMADDGQPEFHLVTGLPSKRANVDQRVVLHNSVLFAAMIVNEGMSSVGFVWRRPATDFLHELTGSLVDGDGQFQLTLAKVRAFGGNAPLGKPRDKDAAEQRDEPADR